ncbi:hypothetical protein CRM22_000387 [Opisthorchis felineus]|uniref:FCP1 homology domain-containing protein n=1 Tax=Opisthorchis felineus TaxID=147828 RepID=A0A4S2MF99_OPIFE|nr:hypothetical protein CRM22_000387 [Opisthorchis felineus]
MPDKETESVKPISAKLDRDTVTSDMKTRTPKKAVTTRGSRSEHQRSLNAVFCGCIAPRGDYTTSRECPHPGPNTQLLPSSAVQSMKRLSLSDQGDADSSHSVTGSTIKLSLTTRQNARLPSSVLFPNSLLLPPKDELCINETQQCKPNNKVDRRWRKFRLRRKGYPSMVVRSEKPCESNTAKVLITTAESVPEDNGVDIPKIDEALVFSPLPSQKAPEMTNVQHGLSVQKVDATLLYAPRFESLFRRHTTLLGPRSENDKGKKCFVIDLDETLVHSSFKMVEQADFKVGVEIDGVTHRVYVLKRPHVDVFLSTMANLYECVLFTASLAKYADPVADFLDKWSAFRYRLFRESCVYHRGNYVKDLSHLGRPINQVVILDNSPASYMFHANHAVQISSWFDDVNDRALLDLIPYFERLASHPNVVEFLRTNTPPTPHAAVGTVGLSTGVFSALAPTSDPIGRSCDSGGVISSIRRPAVASPLPISVAESRVSSRAIPTTTTSDSYPHSDLRKHHSSTGSSRVLSSNALPVITKMAAPSSGPSLNPTHANNDPSVSFPAPLSLASYLPIPPLTNSPVTILSATSGTSSQAHLHDSIATPPKVTGPKSLLNSSSIHPIGLPQDTADRSKVTVYPIPSITRVSTPSAYTPYSSLVRPKTPPTLLAAHRSESGGNQPAGSSSEDHTSSLPNQPQKLGTVKCVPGNFSPLQTVSPPPSVSQSSNSSRKPIS